MKIFPSSSSGAADKALANAATTARQVAETAVDLAVSVAPAIPIPGVVAGPQAIQALIQIVNVCHSLIKLLNLSVTSSLRL